MIGRDDFVVCLGDVIRGATSLPSLKRLGGCPGAPPPQRLACRPAPPDEQNLAAYLAVLHDAGRRPQRRVDPPPVGPRQSPTWDCDSPCARHHAASSKAVSPTARSVRWRPVEQFGGSARRGARGRGPSGTSRRRTCPRRFSSRLASGLPPGSNCLSPDEPRHAGVDRLFEQMLEVSPKPERDPLGDACFDPPLRIHQRAGAEPLCSASSRSRSTSSRAAPPEGDRNPYRRRSSARGSCRGLGPHRIVGELVPVEVELAADETHGGRRHELAGSQQAARLAEHARCCGGAVWPRCSAGPRRLGVAPPQRPPPVAAGRTEPTSAGWAGLSLTDVCRTLNETWHKIHGGARRKRPAP